MNPAQFYTQSVPFIEDTETITVTRYAPGTTDRMARVATQIYAGSADVQIGTGDTYIDAGGAVAQVEAVCIIDPLPDGTLPDVRIDDAVAVTRANGTPDTYTVVVVDPNTFPPAHLELRLKKGVKYAGPSA